MQMRQGGEAKNSIHSFFLFTACRGGEGGDCFFSVLLQSAGEWRTF